MRCSRQRLCIWITLTLQYTAHQRRLCRLRTIRRWSQDWWTNEFVQHQLDAERRGEYWTGD